MKDYSLTSQQVAARGAERVMNLVDQYALLRCEVIAQGYDVRALPPNVMNARAEVRAAIDDVLESHKRAIAANA